MNINYNIPLRAFNTFKMDVTAACMVEYSSIEELKAFFEDNRLSGEIPLPFLHIGGGSNLLFTKDFTGTILHSSIKFIENKGNGKVRVGSGVLWDDFCLYVASQNLWGAENLSLIPGEVGAAAVQNIGAYGREVKDIIESVECYDIIEHKEVIFNNTDCAYSYRDSFFKQDGKGRYIVTAVNFNLSETYAPCIDYGHIRESLEKIQKLTPTKIRETIIDIRKNKLPDPAEIPSAGSFFRNPFVLPQQYISVKDIAEKDGLGDVPHFIMPDGTVKIPAAWLIEKCGWKGFKSGNAGVYEKQPLVIINLTGNATPEEILSMERKIVDSVKNRFGILLLPEVEHI